MFGILGILLAIPAVAILDLLYNSYLMPWLEHKRHIDQRDAAADAAEKPLEVDDESQS
jgi:predicted PurR-regulated permease PerM